MRELTFVTGNENKFHTAEHILKESGIKLLQAAFDIDEIQGEDAQKIALDKAHKAFDIVKKPLLISDDSWSVHGLNGWPGPYMKSMNHWLSADDFLRLTSTLKDRRITLHQIAVYQDEQGQKLFMNDIEGRLLDHAATEFPMIPWSQIITLTKDGRSLAEVRNTSPEQLATENSNVWHQVAVWLKKPERRTAPAA